MARGLKALVGFGTERYAVIDVGTNSVKLHIADRHADGTWSTVVDRAAVTRLGEGIDASGGLEPEPMARTSEAIAAMADESRRAGALAIAAVGTAGLRAAANGQAFVDDVEAACGVRIEIIPGTEEGRIAYVAAKSGLGLARGSLVVFDTGGGSSQFTFGHDDEVEEQFSVPVGAVRLTERHGLDGPVSEEALRATLGAIAGELDCLDDRPTPDVLVGMGGAVTNLTAVKHGLAVYDPDVIQGTRLEAAEIDRQIELYRTRTADERRAIVGLQPNRAEVILAGACVDSHRVDEARLRLARRERPRPAPRPDRRPLRARPARRLSAASARAIGGELRLDRAVDVAVDAVCAEALQDPVVLQDLSHDGLHAREVQPDAGALGEVEDLPEHRRALRVDEVDALQVQDHGAQRRIGVRPRARGRAPRAPRPSRRTGRRPAAAPRSRGTSRPRDCRLSRGTPGCPAVDRAAASRGSC